MCSYRGHSFLWFSPSQSGRKVVGTDLNKRSYQVSRTSSLETPFKSMTGHWVPNYLSSNFISRGNISGRVTRSSTQLNKLNESLFKTKSGKRSFYYRTVTLWNALKPQFKLSESLIIFLTENESLLLKFIFNVIIFFLCKFHYSVSIIFEYFFQYFLLLFSLKSPPGEFK